jgi:hypothetical protein
MIFTPPFIAANNMKKSVNDVNLFKSCVTLSRKIWMTFV